MVFAWPSAEVRYGPDGAANIMFKKDIKEPRILYDPGRKIQEAICHTDRAKAC